MNSTTWSMFVII